MIDYFCKWNSEAEAKQDAARLRNYFGAPLTSGWLLHWFLPNVQAWRISQDVQVPDGMGGMMVQHTYLAGWYGLLALDHQEPVILNDNSLAFALDRDAAERNYLNPGDSPKSTIVIKNNIGAVLQDVGVSPIFAGSHYPMGGY